MGSRTAPYFHGMPVKLLRQIVTLLIVTAFIGATSLQDVPSFAAAAAMNHEAIGGMMHDQDNPDDNMPCKGMLPGCVSDLGCIFLVSLPAPDLTLVAGTAWSSVSYDNASQGLQGRTIKPALGPPIPLG
jgi:hypothetical protein